MNKPFDPEKIELYLEGQLPQEEQIAFQQTIRKNAALAEEVELYRAAEKAILLDRLEDFRETLKEREIAYFKNRKEKDGKVISMKPAWYAIAASVSILILTGAFFYFLQQPSNPSELYASYFEKYPAPGTVRGGQDTQDESLLDRGLRAYRENRYEEAADLLQQASKATNGADATYLYGGVSLMMAGEIHKATELLNEARQNKDTLFDDHASWYLALAELRLERPARARIILKDLKDKKGSSFAAKAEELMEKIKE